MAKKKNQTKTQDVSTVSETAKKEVQNSKQNKAAAPEVKVPVRRAVLINQTFDAGEGISRLNLDGPIADDRVYLFNFKEGSNAAKDFGTGNFYAYVKSVKQMDGENFSDFDGEETGDIILYLNDNINLECQFINTFEEDVPVSISDIERMEKKFVTLMDNYYMAQYADFYNENYKQKITYTVVLDGREIRVHSYDLAHFTTTGLDRKDYNGYIKKYDAEKEVFVINSLFIGGGKICFRDDVEIPLDSIVNVTRREIKIFNYDEEYKTKKELERAKKLAEEKAKKAPPAKAEPMVEEDVPATEIQNTEDDSE